MEDFSSRLWLVLVDQLPKALIALLIPALQLAWRVARERSLSHQKAGLRTAIADLTKQRDQLKALDPSPENVLIQRDVELELAQSVKKLASLVAPPAARQTGAHPRSAVARAFLLYIPVGALGWVLHVLFYVTAAALALGAIGALSQPRDPDFVFILLAIASAFVPVALLRSLARAQDRGHPVADRPTLRRRGRWLPIALSWIAFFYTPIATMGPFMDEPGGFSAENVKNLWPYALALGMYSLLLALASRGWAEAMSAPAEHRRDMPRWRSALLIFQPNKPVGWLALISFWMGISYMVALALFLLKTWDVQDSEGLAMMPIVLLGCALLMFAARRWASLYRPTRPQQDVTEYAADTIVGT